MDKVIAAYYDFSCVEKVLKKSKEKIEITQDRYVSKSFRDECGSLYIIRKAEKMTACAVYKNKFVRLNSLNSLIRLGIAETLLSEIKNQCGQRPVF